MAVPHCVYQVVAARLDRLDSEVRDVLRLAAVVGRTVGERALRTIADAPEHIEACLATLESLNILQRQPATSAERVYRFTYALDWHVASSSVLVRRRAELAARLQVEAKTHAGQRRPSRLSPQAA